MKTHGGLIMTETTLAEPVYLSYRDAAYQQQQQRLQQEAVRSNRANNQTCRNLPNRIKRPRLPHKLAILHFCCRIIGICISIVVLTITLFLLDKFDIKLYYCLAGPAWCILLDFTEASALIDATRKIPRLRFSALAVLEAPAFSIAVTGLINIGATDVPHDAGKCITILWWLDLVMALWRFALMVFMCFCVYCERKNRRAAEDHAKQSIQMDSSTSWGQTSIRV